jgi:hypothetical protein
MINYLETFLKSCFPNLKTSIDIFGITIFEWNKFSEMEKNEMLRLVPEKFGIVFLVDSCEIWELD